MSIGEPNERKQRRNKIDFLEIFNKFRKDGNFQSVGKILGKGSFGEVREIIYKNKVMAGKIVMQDNRDKSGEYIAYDLKGKNIIKINKIVEKEIDNQYYYLIIMEKAVLRDLGKLTEFYHNHNLLKLINEPFDEITSNSLLRFYARQILNALELLNRNHFVHFDLKPENLLISINLIIKLSDFSLLKKIEDKDKIKIPGGTNGYVSLEYYKRDQKISGEDARKQDFFSFGATLYFLKYGKHMLKYKKLEDNESYILTILEKLQTEISRIRADIFADKEFIDFLVSLIWYTPDARPNFEQIYRNKWINKDLQQLNDTYSFFEYDEENIIIELQKQDFLIEKENEKQERNKYQNMKQLKKFKFKKNNEKIRRFKQNQNFE